MNTLYYGDNLKILREYIKDETVDLVYLDPPFNSNRNYNVLFKDESGAEAEAQITAFEDTWHWNAAAETSYHELVLAGDDVSKMVEAFRSFIGTNQMMAYLVMMAVRLKELHRVLKETGSLYLHCDPTASHYLKILLDTIFGAENFRNEIIWKRADAHNDAKKQFGMISDRIYFYSKTKDFLFKPQYGEFPNQTLENWYLYLEFPDGSTRRMTKLERDTQIIPKGARRFNPGDLRSPNPRPNLTYDYKGYKPHKNGWAVSYEKMVELDNNGLLIFPSKPDGRIMRKRYLDEQKGVVLGDVWTDISQIRGANAELLGYPTQKPVALLERIVQASSNEGDTVLDPFCGCGTTIAAAQKLNRHWIGIDITHLSIALQKYRLKDTFGLEPEGRSPRVSKGGNDNTEETALTDVRASAYKIIGEPEDLQSAEQLASEDRYQFQWWALSLIKARPLGAASSNSKVGKKGADKGIDGIIPFIDDRSGKAKRVLVQVKSGKVKSGDIRDLRGTVERENAAIGVFITLENPSRDMMTEAVSAGFYRSEFFHKDFPKIQILTIEELFSGKEVQMPTDSIAFKQAEKFSQSDGQQELF